MFEAAKSKLEDAQNAIEDLQQSPSGVVFRSRFNSCILALRSIGDALKNDKEALQLGAIYKNWLFSKKNVADTDDLLSFINKAKNSDFHHGQHNLQFATYIHHVDTQDLEPPPVPGATVVVNPDGVYWRYKEGHATKKVPVRQGQYVTAATINNPPATHLGAPVSHCNPVHLCKLALDYHINLLHEADVFFGAQTLE